MIVSRMPVNVSPSSALVSAARENELKIALGAEREFALWTEALGEPENILQQVNFYFKPMPPAGVTALKEDKQLLRIRTVLPAASQLSAAGCLAESIINAPDLNTAGAVFAASSLKDAPYIFTLKQGLSQEKGYFRSVELEADLDRMQIIRILRGDLTALGNSQPGAFLSERRITACSFLGQMLNTRYCYRRSNGELWELDLSRFPGHADCELEVETSCPERALSEIRAVARRLDTNIRAQTKTKLQRFLEAQGNSGDSD